MTLLRPLMVVVFLLSPFIRTVAQQQVLDVFETLEGWRAIPSEGNRLTFAIAEGRTGNALVMDFELQSGYAIAQKDFALDLPPNYQFTFDLRAEAPVNNFEFKLLDDKENVFWIKKLNIEYPKTWEKQRIKKRHISFAWGPAGGGEIRKVSKIEFVVSAGSGGKGKIYIDNFRFEPIDDSLAATARAELDVSSIKKGSVPTINDKGVIVENWRSVNEQDWLTINFHHLKEIGGLVIDWEPDAHATTYDVLLSDDGKEWSTAYSVVDGNGGRDYISLPEKDARVLKLHCTKSRSARGFGLAKLEVKGPEFSTHANDFFFHIAGESPQGVYPRYFLREQTNWTIVGASGDKKEALMNELGTIEVDAFQFSLEPFLFVGGKLVTWHDVSRTQSLENDYLPIPSVTWRHGGLLLTVRAFAAGVEGRSDLIVSYRIENTGSAPPEGKLFIAIRPFQVNPPWQWLNGTGGVARIDSIRMDNGLLRVQNKIVIPLSVHSGFGATGFDGGEIVEHLAGGILPDTEAAVDARGFASGALQFDYHLTSGESKEFHLAVPFHSWSGSPIPMMGESADVYVTLALLATMQFWESKLDKVHITLPPSGQSIINTIKSNLAYIFVNRDGPGIQPGSRSYERSWIRDGSLTATALLEFGIQDEVRQFIDWYAQYQFPSGKIPCVVDSRGGDPVDEHDSHGQYIYAVMQHFHFTKDTAWLRTHFDRVVKTVRFIQSLRAQRKTDAYKTGTSLQRSMYGLVPESISHEGYSAKPMHSYWDNFFVLRGLKDAVTIASVLGERSLAREFAAERDDCRKDLHASIRLAMKNHRIDYIPGCAELGDFDATSTTIGIHPANELGSIPEPQLHRTFEKYYHNFKLRRDGKLDWKDYTPYENRVIGSFVYLGQKERAHEALKFFMRDRRPAGWNHWAEVVHRDPATPKFIGDMPHTWCGSDFIRSVRAMFVYEREQDSALVVGAGLADEWVNDPAGVTVTSLPTYHGKISYSVRKEGRSVVVHLDGDVKIPSGKIVLKSPLSRKMKSATIDGGRANVTKGNDVVIGKLPARVELRY